MAGDRVIAEENADHLFTPASVQKLLVATAVLHHLGAEHSITTQLRAAGELRGEVLDGDLVLVAAGDPSWSSTFHDDDPEAPLARLAEQVRDRGVRRVSGALVVDLSAFPGRRFHPDRPLTELGVHVGAPSEGIAVQQNLFEIEIRPGRVVGAPGFAQTEDAIEIDNRMVTVVKERHGRGSVEFLPAWGSDRVVVRGEYPISEGSYLVQVAVPSPALWVAAKLREHLAAVGVEVEGGLIRSTTPSAARGEILATYDTELADLLEPTLADSSNWLAAMLVQRLALVVNGEGRLDDGMELVAEFLEETVGVADSGFALRDASGLSPYNLVSPRTVVAALGFALQAKWSGVLLDSLASNGRGTLAGWPALPKVAAKTGTIRNSLALAGVLRANDAEPVVFAVFLDNDTRPLGRRRRDIAELLRIWSRP